MPDSVVGFLQWDWRDYETCSGNQAGVSLWLRGTPNLSGLLSKGIITQAFLRGEMNEDQIQTRLAKRMYFDSTVVLEVMCDAIILYDARKSLP